MRRNRPATDQETVGGRTEIGAPEDGEDTEDVGVQVETDGTEHPIRESIGADSRVGSRFQDFQGNFVPLPDLPTPSTRNLVVEDPADGSRRVVVIGGASGDDVISTVQCLDINTMNWSTDIYPDLPEPREGSGHCTSDDKIFIVGGLDEDGNETNTIYELDVTEDEPEWVEWEETLDYNVDSYPFVFTYDGELFVIGGSDDEDFGNLRGEVSVFDIEDRSFIEFREPHPQYEGEGSDTGIADGYGDPPIVDGKAYLAGLVDGEDALANGEEFYSYDIEADSWERLADVQGLLFEGDEESDTGFGWGNLREYRGNLVYIDGYNFFEKQDIAYYSIENDEWVGRGIDGVDDMFDLELREGGDPPWFGNNRGPLIDGVIWLSGTGTSDNNLWVYTPERNPFEGE